MPHDPINLGQEIVPRQNSGEHDSVVVDKYIAPAGPDGEVAIDPYKAADRELAIKTRNFLLTRFPIAYEWCVESDLAQGILKISIPILMGVSHWYVINLRTTIDVPAAIVDGCGEILERYLLPRDKFNLGRFLEARAKHSLLVMPFRKIPG